MSTLELHDCTTWFRLGIRGVELSRWLKENSYLVDERLNTAYPQKDGALIARISAAELLWLDALGAGLEVPKEVREDYRCFSVSWRDSHVWFRIRGIQAPKMLAKICEFDLSASAFQNHSVAQTSVAQVSCTIVRDDIDEPSFHLLAESSYDHYLWNSIINASAEFHGDENLNTTRTNNRRYRT